jgi:hypothetical protein
VVSTWRLSRIEKKKKLSARTEEDKSRAAHVQRGVPARRARITARVASAAARPGRRLRYFFGRIEEIFNHLPLLCGSDTNCTHD